MYNKVILAGNLTRDIELRYSQNSLAIANTGLAVNRKFTVNGEKREEVMFVDITFFGRSAEIANQYLRKGSKILVDGRLNFEQWVDSTSGQKRSKHSVVVETMQMLDSRGDASMGGGQPPQGDNSYGNNMGSYSNDSYGGSGYNEPRPQQQSYQKPAPAKMPENNLPEIDINDDEIPF